MRFLTILMLLALLTHVPSVCGQQKPEWIRIAPVEERFQVLLPQEPKVETTEVKYDSRSGPQTARGKLYSASSTTATYMLWSLETLRTPRNQTDEIGIFLDEYADLVWESLLKQVREALPALAPSHISYQSEVFFGGLPGREYRLRLGEAAGVARFYMEGSYLYVLVTFASAENLAAARNFFDGFLPTSTGNSFLAVPLPREPDPFDQVYSPSEVTTRAKVISKPEPRYTEAARKYGVTGLIVLTGIFSTDGHLANIQVVKRLPHGMTEVTIAAAQRIKCTPATKDGQPVPQSVRLEYNFFLY